MQNYHQNCQKGYAPGSTLVLVGIEPEHFPLGPQQAAPEEGINGNCGAEATKPGRDGSFHKSVREGLDIVYIVSTNSQISCL